MVIMKKAARRMLDNKIIDKGIYKSKPVIGDKVIPIARRCGRIATSTFLFSVIFSLLFGVFLYVNW
jgi:hypothetical protein